mgnify:FL=1
MKKYPIFLALYTILIGLSAFFFTNLGKNQIPQIKAATSSKVTVVISNTGSLQTDYDVLLELDTATMISGGTLQSDCDDLRFYDTDDTTPLNYWVESGCNTSTTQVWITVPSIPVGNKNIYLHYNDPAMTNGEQSWSGNFILMNAGGCPSGWTRNTSYDSRFPYGASTYGGTGGANSHSHSTAITSGTGGGGGSADGPGRPASNHTHNLTVTASSATVVPPYLNMVFCQKTDSDISTGLIALFDANAPSGWTRFSALDSKFPQGNSAYGGTGGTNTHSHTVSHSGVSGASHQSGAGGTKTNPVCPDAGHTHSWSNTTSSTVANTPPYLNMIFGSKDSTGTASPNMISMFSALPPLGWTRFSALDSKFPQGNSAYGGTGGSSTHSHTSSGTSGGPSANSTWCLGGGHGSYSSSSHTHSASATHTSGSNLPAYLNTIFAKRNDPVGNGITTIVDNSCSPGPNDTTHTIVSDCSFSTVITTDTNAKYVYGMDPGTSTSNTSTLTINSGTLTVTSDDHLIAGSITLTNGSITIATGGKITPGGVAYFPDSDTDGYPSSTTAEIAFDTPSNKRRRNLMTSIATTDCNDSSDTLYQNLTGYIDSDADGYGTGDLVTNICSGSSLPSTYVANADDCDDNTYSAINSCQKCTGGTETTSGDDRIHTFTSSGTLTCSSTATAQVLVVGGGGGGGRRDGGWQVASGGGGAGAVISNTSYSITPQDYTVTVGNGGSAGSVGSAGSNGGNSIFGTITANGGGGGGGAYAQTGATNGNASGGGGSGPWGGGGTGGAYGNNGGSGGWFGGQSEAAGGGGGSNSNGINAASNDGGDGGNGLSSSISGSSQYYGGGGGGGNGGWGNTGYGGSGGGGRGGYYNAGAPHSASNGTTNTGGGGGGGGGGGAGGSGGSGIIIIRYTE